MPGSELLLLHGGGPEPPGHVGAGPLETKFRGISCGTIEYTDVVEGSQYDQLVSGRQKLPNCTLQLSSSTLA